MIVVSDSTPLISLMKASSLEILKPLFGEVLIPEAVFSELTINPNYSEEAAQIKNSTFIKIVSVEESKAVDVLRKSSGLDLGESEAIIYADNHKADVLLMDEAKGRTVAKSMGLYIMGTIGVLLYAYEEKILSSDNVADALNRLRQSNRHIGDDILKYALAKIKD